MKPQTLILKVDLLPLAEPRLTFWGWKYKRVIKQIVREILERENEI